MAARRFPQTVLFWLGLTVILACDLSGNVPATLAPAGAQALETPTAAAATASPAGGAATEIPVIPGTQTPVSVAPVRGPAIAHLRAGQAIDITYIHMLDANQGWGIGGLAQTQDHVFRTQDGGKDWQDVTPPQPAPSRPGAAVAALATFTGPETGWVVYGAADSANVPPQVFVWHTGDGGASWTYGAIDTTGISADTFSPWYLDFVDSQHGWLLVLLGHAMMHSYVALYSTQDGGATWTDILDPTMQNQIQSFTKTGMIFMDAQTGWLTRDAQGVDSSPHAFLTQDAGVTWTRIDLPAPSGTTGWFDSHACGLYSPTAFSKLSAVFVMKCLDATTYQGQHAFLYSTSDSGQTWQSTALPADFQVLDPPSGGLYFSDAQSGLALGRVIYRTQDGGKSWSAAKQVNWDGQFSFLDLNTGWAVARDAGQIALVQTADGGRTWQQIQPVIAP